MMRYALPLCFLLLQFFPLSLTAYSKDVEPDRDYSLGFWYGYSPSSNYLFAKMHNAQMSLAGLEITHSHIEFSRISFHISTQLILYGITDFPMNGDSGIRTRRTGFGITPLSISVPITADTSYPYLSGGLGLLYFNHRFPNRHGVKLNVTLNAGIGYVIQLNNILKIDLEYRYHHLSNGDTGRINPGMDSNLFVATLHFKL